MAINQFAGEFLLVGVSFGLIICLIKLSACLHGHERREGDAVTRKGWLRSFHSTMDVDWHNKLADSFDRRTGVFCEVDIMYLCIFYSQMVNVVTYSPKSHHPKNLLQNCAHAFPRALPAHRVLSVHWEIHMCKTEYAVRCLLSY